LSGLYIFFSKYKLLISSTVRSSAVGAAATAGAAAGAAEAAGAGVLNPTGGILDTFFPRNLEFKFEFEGEELISI
jgi:hypothetical protein